MQCPNDGQPLAMTTREGIEIDYCPTCRGVWLDRGELDKIIERSAAAFAGTSREGVGPERGERQAPAGRGYDAGAGGYRRDDDDDDRRYEQHGDGRRKKRSFLNDIFDFD